MIQLREMTPTTYVGLSREGASRRAVEVCRIAAETGDTILAAEHLTRLSQIIRRGD